MPLLRSAFEKLYKEGCLFRQVGVILTDFTSKRALQLGLFGGTIKHYEREARLYEVVDALNLKYGRTTVIHGVSLPVTKERPLKKGNSLRIPLLPVELF